MKRKISSFQAAVPTSEDYVSGIQKQASGKYKNVRFQAIPTGPQLLCKQVIDMNLASTPLVNPILTYSLGGNVNFQAGETIDNGTGVTATIATDDGNSIMTISNVVGGTFAINDTITGQTSAATGSIMDYIDTEPTDQELTLAGGSLFSITDVKLTKAQDNNGDDLGNINANGFQIWNGASRTGDLICQDKPNSSLQLLITKTRFVNTNIGAPVTGSPRLRINISGQSVDTQLYANFGTLQGSPATVEVSIYGYIEE